MAKEGFFENFAEAARGFGTLPLVRQITLLVGLSLSVALAFAVVIWVQEPNFRPLFSDMSMQNVSEVVDALQTTGIPYKLDSQTGNVLVPAEQVYQARMKLAAAGVPKNMGQGGFAQFDKESGFGVSRFMEDARYKRAMEEELARTIETIDGIAAARVHLALPKQSAFLSDNAKPSASVLVTLTPGFILERKQVGAIVQMVASSITGLGGGDVTVVDQHGELLSTDTNDAMAVTKEQFDYQQQFQRNMEKRIEGIILPMLGPNSVHAKVSAEIDFEHAEKASEEFNPKDKVIRSEQTLSEQSSGSGASGSPGALSNQPPSSGAGAAGGASNSKNQSAKNYEISKSVSYSKINESTIKQLTVAVVLDDKMAMDSKSGEAKRTPLTPQEIQKITSLVKDAVGFNEKRGDRISIVNSAFAPPEQIKPLPELPIWKQPWVLDIAKKAGGVILGLILISMTMKPMLRSLARKGAEAGTSGAGGGGYLPGGAAGGKAANLTPGQVIPGSMMEEISELKRKQIESIQNMITDNPSRVATVLKNWVGGEKPNG